MTKQDVENTSSTSELSDLSDISNLSDLNLGDSIKPLSSLSEEEVATHVFLLAHIDEEEKMLVVDVGVTGEAVHDKLVFTLTDLRNAVHFEQFTQQFRSHLSGTARKAHDELIDMYADRDSQDEKTFVRYNEKLIEVSDILAMELEEKEDLQKLCDEQEDLDAVAVENFASRVCSHFSEKYPHKKLAVVLLDPIATLNAYPDEYEVMPHTLRDALVDAGADVFMLEGDEEGEQFKEEQEEKAKNTPALDLQHKLGKAFEHLALD
ncbi:hypothetical protein E3P86_03572 [Wallemia ichthyophaga]|uniref:Uncharacterized protein n=1 Tax=Wallemia ichthyophaga TaxID=245174 RepID=A0A4T0IMI2_WALIC|nr:hypothetical protein E3P86_03572 [Wallemia ichthyophaga]